MLGATTLTLSNASTTYNGVVGLDEAKAAVGTRPTTSSREYCKPPDNLVDVTDAEVASNWAARVVRRWQNESLYRHRVPVARYRYAVSELLKRRGKVEDQHAHAEKTRAYNATKPRTIEARSSPHIGGTWNGIRIIYDSSPPSTKEERIGRSRYWSRAVHPKDNMFAWPVGEKRILVSPATGTPIDENEILMMKDLGLLLLADGTPAAPDQHRPEVINVGGENGTD